VVAVTKNEFPHFNPAAYDINVKIATVRTGSHSKFNINYHIIWIPKYRRKILVGRVERMLRSIIEAQCDYLGVELLALEIMPDHIHLFVGATPNHKPFQIVKQIKGYSSHEMRKTLWEARQLGYVKPWKQWKSLWARGYYCGSAGHVSQDAVKRYILEQQHKENVFEYSIFGDSKGTTKIGDFTQSKLERWSK